MLLGTLCCAVTITAAEQSVLQHIETDFAQGKLSQVESVTWQLAALRGLSLPEAYRTDTVPFTRRTTELMAIGRKLASTGQDHALLRSVLARPQLPLSIVSPSGRFRIHYSDSGVDAATAEFIQETAKAFDYSWDIEVGELGFAPPPGDYNTDGPEYDIFVHQCSDYGATMPEFEVPETPQDDFTGWIELDNDFTHTPTKGLDGMRVTAAHELFHLIQFGYRSYHLTTNSSVYFYECFAAWMEDIVYDDINDYYHYLRSFFKSPQASFITANGNHEYGLSIYNHMLSQKYGTALIVTVWQNMSEKEPLNALNDALLEYSSNFNTELAEFNVWNCFTGTRADTVNFYQEGKNFPALTVNQDLVFNTQLTFKGTMAPLGSNYGRIAIETGGTDLLIAPAFADPYHAMYACVLNPNSTHHDYFIRAGNVDLNIPSTTGLSELWIIPVSTLSPYPSAKEQSFQFNLNIGQSEAVDNRITQAYPNPFILSVTREITFTFQLKDFSEETFAYILTENGQPVSTLTLGPCMRGWNSCTWNGKNQNKAQVSAGVYLLYLKAAHWQGSFKFAVLR